MISSMPQFGGSPAEPAPGADWSEQSASGACAMPQNPIQFQHGMSLSELIAQYGTEAQCEQALERARWPGGFVCPECGTPCVRPPSCR